MINSSKYVDVTSSIFGVKSSAPSGGVSPEPPIEQDWYDQITGMVTCSNDLLECNEEIIPCL